ncbi:MAG: hypothetical protein GX222_01515 [Ruminococcaceae bacterium]|nr:hypothetical protein [Oscillospiraceae bacterium]
MKRIVSIIMGIVGFFAVAFASYMLFIKNIKKYVYDYDFELNVGRI